MKKITTLTALILSFFLTHAQTKNYIDQPYIEVNGSADTFVVPNLIYVKIRISEKDNRDRTSIEEQENKMLTALKNLGINTDTDLSTSDIVSNFKFYLLKKRDIFKSKEYILKLNDALTASKVFIELEEIDISNVSIDRIEHSDFENLKQLCRAKAIENAYKKAISLTKPIAQSIGNAIHIVETDGNNNYQINTFNQTIRIRGMKTLSLDKNEFEVPKIEFEKIKVSAQVGVKFILK